MKSARRIGLSERVFDTVRRNDDGREQLRKTTRVCGERQYECHQKPFQQYSRKAQPFTSPGRLCGFYKRSRRMNRATGAHLTAPSLSLYQQHTFPGMNTGAMGSSSSFVSAPFPWHKCQVGSAKFPSSPVSLLTISAPPRPPTRTAPTWSSHRLLPTFPYCAFDNKHVLLMQRATTARRKQRSKIIGFPRGEQVGIRPDGIRCFALQRSKGPLSSRHLQP